MIDESAIRLRFRAHDPVLDERGRRRFAAAEALAAGPGGVTAVSRATGIARSTINRGLTVRSEIDTNAYPKGVKITDAEMDALNLLRHEFQGD